MDLTIQLEGTTLNIRVAIIMKTKRGYLFEKNKKGYLFMLGGRVKAGESSLEAAQREVLEETGYGVGQMQLVAIIENFFDNTDASMHEICFIYHHEGVVDLTLPAEFIEIPEDQLASQDIRPEIMRKIIAAPKDKIMHAIVT